MAGTKSNPLLVSLIDALKEASREHDAPLWRDLAERLEKPRQSWAEVNVSRLQRVLDEGETAVVAGKLLGTGHLTKAVTVAAFQASDGARRKVADAGGELLRIEDLLEDDPSGTGVRIVA